MKIENIYRGKRVGGGEWVYGDLLHDKDGHPHIVPRNQATCSNAASVNGCK